MDEHKDTGLDSTAIALILCGIAIILGAVIYFQKPESPKNAQNIDLNSKSDVLGSPNTGNQIQQSNPEVKQKMQDTDKLLIEDTQVGTGAEATNGAKITVNYTGMLTDGKVFDSSIPRNQPFTFNLGAGQVIQGWEQGFVGMKVGGKRKLTIPPSLGYGPQGTGPIPGNATLIFDVELLKVE